MGYDRTNILFYDSISDQFDAIMKTYDLNTRLEIVFNRLLSRHTWEASTLLEPGCGTGWFSKEARKRKGEVVSLDIGFNLLKKTSEKCDSARIAGDLHNLPFAKNSFDIVICSEVLEHTFSPENVFQELTRVLKENGVMVVTIPNGAWSWLFAVFTILKLRFNYKGIENKLSLKDIDNWAEKHNVAIETFFSFCPLPILIARKKKASYFLCHFNNVLSQLMPYTAVLIKKPYCPAIHAGK